MLELEPPKEIKLSGNAKQRRKQKREIEREIANGLLTIVEQPVPTA